MKENISLALLNNLRWEEEDLTTDMTYSALKQFVTLLLKDNMLLMCMYTMNYKECILHAMGTNLCRIYMDRQAPVLFVRIVK